MADKQHDHNLGQKHGAEASGMDQFVENLNPLTSAEYKAGFRHGRAQQEKAKEKEQHHTDLPSSGGGSSGGGGGCGAGGGMDLSFTDICIWIAIIFFVIPVILLAIFSPKRPPPPASLDIAVYDSDQVHFVRALECTPGRSHQIFFRISYDSTLGFYTEKPMEVELLQNNSVLFRQLVDHKQFSFTPSNTVIVPYEAEFSVGRYVARISAENVKTREYDFSVIDASSPANAATNRAYWTVSPSVAGHIEIFVTDSFQRIFPGPPKSQMYSLPDNPKWFYIDVHNDGLTPEQGNGVYLTVLREGAQLWREDVFFPADKNEIYLQWESDGTAGHYLLRAFYNHGQQYLDFPFTLREGADPSNLTGDTQFHPILETRSRLRTAASGGAVKGDSLMEAAATRVRTAPMSTRSSVWDKPIPGPFQLKNVVTCESVTASGTYKPQSTFYPGGRLCIYAEALFASFNGHVKLTYTFTLTDPHRQTTFVRSTPISSDSLSVSWPSWFYFELPTDLKEGVYTMRVDVKNELTEQTAIQFTPFVVAAN